MRVPEGIFAYKGMLPLDVVVHVHQVADGADIIGDVGIAVDGVLDGAACHRKVYHVHGLVVVEHGVDEAAGEGVAAAHAVEDVEGDSLLSKVWPSYHIKAFRLFSLPLWA